jgi:hypothetical protein
VLSQYITLQAGLRQQAYDIRFGKRFGFDAEHAVFQVDAPAADGPQLAQPAGRPMYPFIGIDVGSENEDVHGSFVY